MIEDTKTIELPPAGRRVEPIVGRSFLDRLNRGERPTAKGKSCSLDVAGVGVSVMTREDARVDCAEPWIAKCDDHGEMIPCDTKKTAMMKARHREWCSRCSG